MNTPSAPGWGAVSGVLLVIGSLREADRSNQLPHRSPPGLGKTDDRQNRSPQKSNEVLEEQLAWLGIKMPRRSAANFRAQKQT